MEMSIEEMESICMKMISHAGEGRALVHEAIDLLIAGDTEQSQQKLEEAQEQLTIAHQIQFADLLSAQASGTEIPFHVLLIHSMDLVMISTSEMDIAKKILSGIRAKENHNDN
jgi:cellobiose-specific phosphotransferase system component IIA